MRYSYFTLAPYRLPFEDMDAWYRAVDRFARLVRDPRHQIQLSLRAGEWLLYDNHRMLHRPHRLRGPRWVRGISSIAADASPKRRYRPLVDDRTPARFGRRCSGV